MCPFASVYELLFTSVLHSRLLSDFRYNSYVSDACLSCDAHNTIILKSRTAIAHGYLSYLLHLYSICMLYYELSSLCSQKLDKLELEAYNHKTTKKVYHPKNLK